MHKERLIIFLETIMPLSKAFTDYIHISVTPEFFHKGLLLASEGKPSSQAWFITGGLAKEYYYDESGKQVIINFWQEGEMMLTAENLFSNERIKTYLELIEDSTVLTIQKDEVILLKEQYPELHKIGYRMLILLKKKGDLRGKLLGLPTKERYSQFMDQFPWPRFSGKDISSYLGMSREQLTRLRS